MIPSRARVIAEFEKPSKYFLSFEKAKQQINHIRSLQHNGQSIFQLNALLDMQSNYFAKLYAEKSDISHSE